MWGAWLWDWNLWGENLFPPHVISWTEWVQRGICAAVLYYRHNDSQIRETGRKEWGREKTFTGKEEGGTPNTSVLSLSAAITPNHKHGHVQICLCLERPSTEMFPDLGFLTRGLVGILCRLSVIPMFVRVTLTSTVVAQTSRWPRHVNHFRQLLTLPCSSLCMRLRESLFSRWI